MPPCTGVCRVCLATDVQMLAIGGALQQVYEKLVGTALHADWRPVVVCYICHALLHKARRLMLRAITAEKALRAILDMYSVVTKSTVALLDRREAGLCPSLAVSRLEYLDSLRPGLAVKTEHELINYANGELDDLQSSKDDSAPAAAASDVESERGGEPADSSTEPRAEAEDRDTQNSKDEQQEAPHKCPRCPRRFKRAWHLRQHIAAHDARSLCTCGRRFKRRWHLKQHLLYCSAKQEKHECSVCLRQFVHKKNLEQHVRNIHSSEKCKVCEYKCATKEQLILHLRTHAEKPQQCDFCQQQFLHKAVLERHVRNRHPMCKICQHQCINRADLESHLATHATDPYKCPVCQKGFALHKVLLLHLEHHSQNSLFCVICERQFSHRYLLTRHLRTHIENKPHVVKHTGVFKCNVCRQRFKSNSTLRDHLKKHSYKHKCHICQYQSRWSSNLKTHLRTHSDEKQFVCNVCHVGYRSNQPLQQHLRMHDVEHRCDACRRRFDTRDALLAHMNTHEPEDDEPAGSPVATAGDKPYQCSLCPMQFSLKIAFRKHVIAEHL